MNKEQYVTFEVAKLLKDKGFDWEVRSLYGEEGDMGFSSWSNNYNTQDDLYSAPTQQMTMRWLREEHDIDIIPVIAHNQYYALESPIKLYSYRIYDIDGKILKSAGDWHKSYENAIESALLYILENLV